MSQFLWYDCIFKKQCTVPVTLNIELWRSIIFQWIEYNPISACMAMYPVYISDGYLF